MAMCSNEQQMCSFLSSTRFSQLCKLHSIKWEDGSEQKIWKVV